MPYRYELFNINEYMELPELDEYERCWHINTGNHEDEVYAIIDVEEDEKGIEDKLRFELVRKYGARFHDWVLDYEDVTDLYWGEHGED